MRSVIEVESADITITLNCKYNEKYKFAHPIEIYQVGKKCKESSCQSRHPKPCKWFQGKTGWMREESCEFSHEPLVLDDGRKIQKIRKEIRLSAFPVKMNGKKVGML